MQVNQRFLSKKMSSETGEVVAQLLLMPWQHVVKTSCYKVSAPLVRLLGLYESAPLAHLKDGDCSLLFIIPEVASQNMHRHRGAAGQSRSSNQGTFVLISERWCVL